MALIDSIVIRYIRFDSCNVFISALELSTFIYISYIIRLSIDFLPLTPRGCATASVWGIHSQFFPTGFFGFSYQVAHVNSLA